MRVFVPLMDRWDFELHSQGHSSSIHTLGSEGVTGPVLTDDPKTGKLDPTLKRTLPRARTHVVRVDSTIQAKEAHLLWWEVVLGCGKVSLWREGQWEQSQCCRARTVGRANPRGFLLDRL